MASLLLLIALLALALSTFHDYSISNDEAVQNRYGEMILRYFASDFADHSLFNFDNLYLYGGLFDVTSLLLTHIFPGDIYVIRHAFCAVIGVGGIAATWATARLIAGPRAGAIASLALAACGVWYGAMFNHTKDIPFAAAMIGASYFVLRAVRALPRPRLRDLVAFGLMLGAALGQRALGLLLIAYVPLAIALYTPQPFASFGASRFFGRSFVLFVPTFALGYLIMIVAWPWSAISLFNPVRAIFAFSHFAYPIKTLLFGHVYFMADVPRDYEPVYLAVKLPLVVLFGALLALVAAVYAYRTDTISERRRARETIFIAMMAAVPVLLHVADHGPAFSGMRHFLFVVPPLAVMAGIGLDRAWVFLVARSTTAALVGLAGAAFSFAWTASVLVRLHPYEYLYFNEFVGGLAGANQRYDTDYWVNVMHEAVTKLDNVIDHERKPAKPYRVAVCSDGAQFEHDAAVRKDLQLAADADPADFFIAPTHMRCDDAMDGQTIIRIERMGTLIGVVKDRRALTRPSIALRR